MVADHQGGWHQGRMKTQANRPSPLVPAGTQRLRIAAAQFGKVWIPAFPVGILAASVGGNMRRRDFITLLGGAAASWPLAARAQQQAVIGILQQGAPASYDLSGFRQGLKDAGYVEGQNLTIEYRWADNRADRLPELAADIVRRQVRVIVSIASALSVSAARAATSTIPIVFGYGADPVRNGHVASLNRPGGNVTGMTSLSAELVGKQLGILRETLPQAVHFGVLGNPQSGTHESFVREAQAAAAALGVTVEFLNASTRGEMDAAFARLADEKRVQGLLVSNDPFLLSQRAQLTGLAARHAVPAIYSFHEQAEAGGLMSYGPNLTERDREVGHYVGRILKGEKPADLPVQQQAKFQFVINLKTARAIGLTISNAMQLLADEVIE
jgi:putative ABC transport system substrate-binding protein